MDRPLDTRPGYYKTIHKALRLRELVGRFGFRRGLRGFLKRGSMRSNGGIWMPHLWSQNECRPEELSEEFWLATKPHRRDFEQLGFTQCRLYKTNTIGPIIRDSGGVNFLDPTRRHFARLNYFKLFEGVRGERNEILISFTAAFADRILTCTNQKIFFERLEDIETVHVDSYEVKAVHQRFLELLQKRQETPRAFPNIESLQIFHDERETRQFEERVRRGLFVRMTDTEIAAARAQLRNPSAAPLARRPPRFGFSYTIWFMIIGCALVFEYVRPASHGHSDRAGIMDYRGMEFKTRIAYASYEDYKDDPNNLDTNELPRIEQVMTNAPMPHKFKNSDELLRYMFENLKFPGYGMGGVGENSKTDDGSRLLVETVEIPQRDKERVFTFRQTGEGLDLLDDFVYSTTAGGIAHVKLEKQILHYYDAESHSLREKTLEFEPAAPKP